MFIGTHLHCGNQSWSAGKTFAGKVSLVGILILYDTTIILYDTTKLVLPRMWARAAGRGRKGYNGTRTACYGVMVDMVLYY